ncbi:Tetratricopeptide TPR_1 repeat-containing protein [Thermodesulfobacterium geofontis OPF15]|jgi:Tfp pilus assembly protein PilF|uniref:Tetratricopeptide TPR_1 repeat-containing protein n=1 Tax=Thermodesulfobacterium geofontis (strain OPF15) TaxID=795359 RepID=F8C4A3_THEGP|nr:tetratricopeptide repeat protein [Thermodesulfobacterium geofontis]AEH22604.1 Tetratricopeptide TPR_1 repeat-containing protein [Thermodesulfobacterium geofontis OPF15]
MDIEELFLEGARILTLKQFDSALEIFNKVLEIDPNHIKALEARAVIYMQKNELELAQNDLEKAISIEPENARLYFRLGQIYYRKKDLDKALELFTKAIDLEPTYPAAYMARSQVLREKGLEEAADLELDKAVAVQRELAKARRVVDF